MPTNNKIAMLEHCDKLTENGQQLSISWDGGNDNGGYCLLIDDTPVLQTNEIEDQLLHLVNQHVGYGSFAGDFSAAGEIIYNRKEKCFEGTDEYTEDMSDSQACYIPIRVPEEVWFDSLHLVIEGQCFCEPEVRADLIINNGPYLTTHSESEDFIQNTVRALVHTEMKKLDDISNIWEERWVSFQDFTRKEKHLEFIIEYFDFNFSKKILTPIHISLTDQIVKHEIL